MEITAAIEGRLLEYVEGRVERGEAAMMRAAVAAGERLKLRLRADVRSAGMGDRLANTWRSITYPTSGKSLSPAAFVYSRAPEIVTAFSDGATIRPVGGSVYLWIPTENVPRSGSRKRMTPSQVEDRFNDDFAFIPVPNRPGTYLAAIDAIEAKSGKGFRRASQGRKNQGRETRQIVMFILTRQVRLKARLSTRTIFDEALRMWPDMVARELVAAFAEGAT